MINANLEDLMNVHCGSLVDMDCKHKSMWTCCVTDKQVGMAF